MFQKLASKLGAFQRNALVGALTLTAAAFVIGTTPASAMFFHGGGGGGFHGGGFHGGFSGGFHNQMGVGGFHNQMAFGGFRHDFDHRFSHRRFGFVGFGFWPGYDYDYDAYYGCWRRVWGPYGWRLVNVCGY